MAENRSHFLLIQSGKGSKKMEDPKTPALNKATVSHWLQKDITLTAPGWIYAAAGVVLVVLLGIALD